MEKSNYTVGLDTVDNAFVIESATSENQCITYYFKNGMVCINDFNTRLLEESKRVERITNKPVTFIDGGFKTPIKLKELQSYLLLRSDIESPLTVVNDLEYMVKHFSSIR